MIRSIAYKTLTSADTNYPISADTVKGRVTVINDNGAAGSNGNTARVFVGGSADALTDKRPLATSGSCQFLDVPSSIYARSGSAGQVICVIIED